MQIARRLVVILAVLSFCGWSADNRAKNIILFLGDAAGIPTLHAASIHAHGKPGQLFIQHMPYFALSETSSAADWVSDSAAGMTAIVTGRKTQNGVLSQSEHAVRGKTDGEALKTILEYAEERGLSTGVVSNSSIASATPAACYAHVNSRSETGQIFAQALKPRFGDGVDVMVGPGLQEIAEATQKLGIDLEAALSKAGYFFARELHPVPEQTRRAVILLSEEEFDLGAAAKLAIDVLSRNPKGFFLMVESDLHTDKLVRGLERAAKFDRLIQDTAARMAKDTLILFTADHSFDLRIAGKAPTGEPLVTVSESGKAIPSKAVVVDGHHSAEEVLVAAQGPGAERVRGFISNTDLFRIMIAAYGWAQDGASGAGKPASRK
jgi:alkaline phosphatase